MKNRDKKVELIRGLFMVFLILFLLVIGVVCLIGLIDSINSFIDNQKVFNKAYSEAAATIVNLPPHERTSAQTLIDHLEKLQQIQKNATTNDVMSFLYSTLSTILVGLCAGFVAKSYKNVETANAAAQEASKNAEATNKHAQKVQENAKKTNEYAQKAQEKAQESEKNANQTKASLEKAKELYNEANNQINKQKAIISILSIHIEIVHARAALVACDKIAANQRISNIKRMVNKIENTIEKNAIHQLLQEILCLETAVESYREYVDTIKDPAKKESALQAIDRYKSDINNAETHCEWVLSKK